METLGLGFQRASSAFLWLSYYGNVLCEAILFIAPK